MAANLTVGELLVEAIARLNSDSAVLDAELLLAHALEKSRTWIKAHPEAVPEAGRVAHYSAMIGRRARGEPVAYILGYRDFWKQRVAVSPQVLVPRPETELLVERALALIGAPVARVVDLGTGSGAIAIALAGERIDWAITGTDISPAALAVARDNAASLGLARVELLVGDWFEPLAGRRFDLVVSNPPYIAERDPALLDPSLRYEPPTALVAGADGLASLRAIIGSAPRYLERRGWLLLEHGCDQAAAVGGELVVRGFTRVRSHRDLAGHERVTEAQWPDAQVP